MHWGPARPDGAPSWLITAETVTSDSVTLISRCTLMAVIAGAPADGGRNPGCGAAGTLNP